MRILAVKTDPVVLEVLVELLVDRTGYGALAALTTQAAEAMLNDPVTQPFDCILIDADVDQAETLRFVTGLRAHPRHAVLPVLVLTSDVSKTALDGIFHAGATDIIAKPFEISALGGHLALAGHTAPPKGKPRLQDPIDLHAALSIFEAPAFIPRTAFENYAKQLSRHRHGGSPVFAFAISDIDALHRRLSPFAFHCMINDVAEVAATQMPDVPHLLTYAGAGVFMAAVADTWHPHTAPLAVAITLALRSANICDDADGPLQITVRASHALRLGTSRAACETLAQVREQAQKTCQSDARTKAPYILLDRIA